MAAIAKQPIRQSPIPLDMPRVTTAERPLVVHEGHGYFTSNATGSEKGTRLNFVRDPKHESDPLFVMWNDTQYNLVEIHLHWRGGEHLVNGWLPQAEIHFHFQVDGFDAGGATDSLSTRELVVGIPVRFNPPGPQAATPSPTSGELEAATVATAELTATTTGTTAPATPFVTFFKAAREEVEHPLTSGAGKTEISGVTSCATTTTGGTCSAITTKLVVDVLRQLSGEAFVYNGSLTSKEGENKVNVIWIFFCKVQMAKDCQWEEAKQATHSLWDATDDHGITYGEVSVRCDS